MVSRRVLAAYTAMPQQPALNLGFVSLAWQEFTSLTARSVQILGAFIRKQTLEIGSILFVLFTYLRLASLTLRESHEQPCSSSTISPGGREPACSAKILNLPGGFLISFLDLQLILHFSELVCASSVTLECVASISM